MSRAAPLAGLGVEFRHSPTPDDHHDARPRHRPERRVGWGDLSLPRSYWAACLCACQLWVGMAQEVVGDIVAAGGSADAVTFDVIDVGQDCGHFRYIRDGAIEILVYNPGDHNDAVMPGIRREQWSQVIDLWLNG
jgi:hypothetical protein